MKNRPLCVVCSCFIFLTVLLTILPVAAPWKTQLPPGCEADVRAAKSGRIYGQIYRMQIQKDSCILYLKNSILVVHSNQYILNNSKITYDDVPDTVIGDSVMVSGKVSFAEAAGNQGQFDALRYDTIRHISLRMKAKTLTVTQKGLSPVPELARHLRLCISREIDREMDASEAGVLKTMLLGDKQDLEEDIRTLYQKNGISHILAISGLHISVLGTGLYKMMRKKLGITPAAILSGGFLFFYLILTDFPVSAQRAVCMFWLRLGADVSGRTYDEPTAIAVAALMILCQNPMYITDSGFLLSFGAAVSVYLCKTAGIRGKGFGIWLWLCMLPLTLLFYYEISFSGLVLNLFMLAPLGLVLFLGLAGGVLGNIVPVLGTVCLTPVSILLKLYAWLCRIAVQIPGSSLITGRPSWWQIAVYTAGITALLQYKKRKMQEKNGKETGRKRNGQAVRQQMFGACCAVTLVACLLWRSPAETSVTMLDVGQGDGLVIRDGYSTFLVDGGSTTVSKVGRYRIVPWLKYMGIQKIERIFLTHPDEDHMNGLEELLDMIDSRELGMTVGGLVVPSWMQAQETETELLKKAQKLHIPITYAVRGQRYTAGSMELQILHPDQKIYTENTNEGSLTFRLKTKGFSMLFTGDLEGEGEESVCREDIASTVLKVAHHGSKNSTGERFLQQARPQLALISCGKGNRYGHPAKETLKRLKKAGCNVYTTMDCGALTVRGRKGKVSVSSYRVQSTVSR